MNRAIANLVRIAGVDLPDAVRAATINPARLIHLGGRQQGLTASERGDLVIFRQDLTIEAVYLDGVRVA